MLAFAEDDLGSARRFGLHFVTHKIRLPHLHTSNPQFVDGRLKDSVNEQRRWL